MTASFVAVDVETANAERSSVCQVGVVRVEDGTLTDTFKTLVNPQTYFDPFNVSIHGITEEMVEAEPTFPEIESALNEFIGPSLVASHTAFDRVAFGRLYEKYRLAPPAWHWLDTARVARRAWAQQFGRSGYGLACVAAFCGIEFQRHDALEDARAAALILVRAVSEIGLDLEGWQQRVRQPIFGNPMIAGKATIVRDGDPDGPLAGEEIVFTGALIMTRAEAATVAARLGCDVGQGVTKKTTMLVVGIQDGYRLNGYEKSAKHRKAEKLIAAGQPIAILTEDDFLALLRLHEDTVTT